MQELCEGIIAEVTEKHPICYECFTLCELSQQNKLKRFNIDMLVRICEHFELDIATVSVKFTKVDVHYIEAMVYATEA